MAINSREMRGNFKIAHFLRTTVLVQLLEEYLCEKFVYLEVFVRCKKLNEKCKTKQQTCAIVQITRNEQSNNGTNAKIAYKMCKVNGLLISPEYLRRTIPLLLHLRAANLLISTGPMNPNLFKLQTNSVSIRAATLLNRQILSSKYSESRCYVTMRRKVIAFSTSSNCVMMK